MNSTAPSPSEIAVYCALLHSDTCLGICPNPGIGGVGARSAAFAQAVISGYSIVWLSADSDRKKSYYVQCLSSTSLVVVGYLYGGFLSEKSVTAYHGLLITYLTMGNSVSGAVAFSTKIFKTYLELAVFFSSLLVFAVAVTYLTVVASITKTFGSQPECDSGLVEAPYIPLGALIACFTAIPWIISILSMRIALCIDPPVNPDDGHHHIFRNFRRHMFWSVFLAVYYTAWIYMTEKYVHSQKIHILTSAESKFTQAQVQSLSLAIISAFFPLRAILNGFHWQANTVKATRRHSRASTGDSDASSTPLVSPGSRGGYSDRPPSYFRVDSA